MDDRPDEQMDERKLAEYERRAPGAVIRCMRCGFTEPFGKYGVWVGGGSTKSCTLAWCSRCRRLCCHATEKRRGLQPFP